MKTIYDPRYGRMIELLKARRKELGLTQVAVTTQLRVQRTWLGKVEQKERRLDCLEALRLCRLYGIGFGDIEGILLSEEKSP